MLQLPRKYMKNRVQQVTRLIRTPVYTVNFVCPNEKPSHFLSKIKSSTFFLSTYLISRFLTMMTQTRKFAAIFTMTSIEWASTLRKGRYGQWEAKTIFFCIFFKLIYIMCFPICPSVRKRNMSGAKPNLSKVEVSNFTSLHS